jgi:hypothetical protein
MADPTIVKQFNCEVEVMRVLKKKQRITGVLLPKSICNATHTCKNANYDDQLTAERRHPKKARLKQTSWQGIRSFPQAIRL